MQDEASSSAIGSSPFNANGSLSNGHRSDGGETSRPARAPEPTANGNSSSNAPNLNLAEGDGEGSAFLPLWTGSTIDKRELVRLTLQSLRELGYETTAKSLESESGLTLEHPSITAFRGAVLSGDWRNAERLLIDGLSYAARKANNEAPAPSLDSVLQRPDVTSLESLRFMIQRQRYLELLEARKTKKALSVLRDRLTPISQDTDQLHLLSSLVLCATPEELQKRAKWDGSRGESRRRLLTEIEKAISPSIMVPSRRLPTLLEQAQAYQKQQDPFFNLPPGTHISLLVDRESDRSVFPSEAAQVLRGHKDEVWHLEYSHDGTKLATCGRDKYVILWSVGDEYQIIEKLGPHADPVPCVAWSPDDQLLLATSEAEVTLWDMVDYSAKTFSEHDYTIGTASWLPDGTFVTGGMDGKIIFWDGAGKKLATINTSPFRVLALAASPDGRHLVAVSNRQTSNGVPGSTSRQSSSQHAPPSSATGSSLYSESPSPASTSAGAHGPDHGARGHGVDDIGGGSRVLKDERHRIHFIDAQTRKEVGSVYMWEEMNSVCISGDSRYALINHRPNEVQLWSIQGQTLIRKFSGHTMEKHVIRCGLGGIDENFVVSGSEDGCVYVWHRPSGRLIETLHGHDAGSVNAVCWHPKDARTVASCGDDHTVRIWRPSGRPTRRVAMRKEEADPPSDDSVMSAAANPFPWTNVGSPGAQESEAMFGEVEGMDEAT